MAENVSNSYKINLTTQFNEIVIKICKELDIKPQAVATLLGVTPGALSNLRNLDKQVLKRYKPKVRALKTLIQYLNENRYIKPYNLPGKIETIHLNWIDKNPKISHTSSTIVEIITSIIASGDKTLKILDTWFPYFKPSNQSLLNSILNHFDTLEILTLNPLSNVLTSRFKSLKIESNIGWWEALEGIKILIRKSEQKEINCRIIVKFYDELPGVKCLISENYIYSSNFLSKKSTHLYQKVSNTSNFISEEINEHFDSLWYNIESETVTSDSLNILSSRVRALIENYSSRESKYIKLLSGAYTLYNLDEDDKYPFQKSQIKIYDEKHPYCELSFLERDHSSTITYLGEVKQVGKNDLLLTFQRGTSFFISILVYIEPNAKEKPDIIQVLYIHYDQNLLPRSSIGLLVDLSNASEEEQRNLISRKRKDIGIIFQNYLATRATPTIQLLSGITTLEDLHVRHPKSKIFEKIIGDWAVFYPNRFSGNPRIDKDYYLTSLGIGRILIEKKINQYDVTFKTNTSEIKGNAEILSISKVSDYLKIDLFLSKLDNKSSFYINMVFRLKREGVISRLFGTYNIIYPNKDSNGAGFIEFNREPKIEPRTVNLIEETNVQYLDARTVRQLLFKGGSSIIWNKRVSEEKKKKFSFSGLYNVYTHGMIGDKKEEEEREKENSPIYKCITSGLLYLDNNQFAKFKGTHKGGLSFGKVSQVMNNLFIELSSKGANSQDRLGYFIIGVNEEGTDKNSVYGGIFLGLSGRDNYPLAKRVIFEYRGEDNPEKAFSEFEYESIELYSKKYFELKKEIRDVLTGRIPNYIGYQRAGNQPINWRDFEKYSQSRLNMGEIFAYSALFRIIKGTQKNDYKIADKSILRAVEHGFMKLEIFEEELRKKKNYEEIIENLFFYRKLKALPCFQIKP